MRGHGTAGSAAGAFLALVAAALHAAPTAAPASDARAGLVDPLAAWIPADAAAAMFPSFDAAVRAAEALQARLPRLLPGIDGDGPDGRREALARLADGLLLPSSWRTNPGVPTGTRSVALVVADPDVARAPDVALVCEVDDAARVLGHRRASLLFEDRAHARFRVDGADAWTDDGAVRSYFALEGGVAVFASTRDLRARILAAGRGTGPALAREGRGELDAARAVFAARASGGLLVVPPRFAARAAAGEMRARRAASLRCAGARIALDEISLAGGDLTGLRCPAGGALAPVAGGVGASCPVHGTTASPLPLGDVAATPDAGPLPRPASPGGPPAPATWGAAEELVAGTVGFAVAYGPGEASHVLAILVPDGAAGEALLATLARLASPPSPDPTAAARVARRLDALARAGVAPDRVDAAYARWTGLLPPRRGEPPRPAAAATAAPRSAAAPIPSRPEGASVLEARWPAGPEGRAVLAWR